MPVKYQDHSVWLFFLTTTCVNLQQCHLPTCASSMCSSLYSLSVLSMGPTFLTCSVHKRTARVHSLLVVSSTALLHVAHQFGTKALGCLPSR
jgi:hypothetical protein